MIDQSKSYKPRPIINDLEQEINESYNSNKFVSNFLYKDSKLSYYIFEDGYRMSVENEKSDSESFILECLKIDNKDNIISTLNMPNKEELSSEVFIHLNNKNTFYLVTYERLIEYDFSFLQNEGEMKKKIKLIDIKMICITSNHRKLLIFYESKSKLKSFEILSRNNKELLNFNFTICKLCFESFSSIKNTIVIPDDLELISQLKKSENIKKIENNLDTFIKNIFSQLISETPFDFNEECVKFLPLEKIEYHETEMKERVSSVCIVISNKRIFEMKDRKSVSYHSFSKLFSLNINQKENRIELVFDQNATLIYRTILTNHMMNIIKTIQSNECLNLLKITKIK
jgi:hypothetical protein